MKRMPTLFVGHGMWAVLVHMFPDASIPVVQLSINKYLNPNEMYQLGTKLQSLRDEGYLIMSGIIKDKWDMVRESAESAGFFLETHMVQGEWNACVFKKTKDISGVIGG